MELQPSTSIHVLFTETAGPITKTDIQGSWTLGTSLTETQITTNLPNPDSLAFQQYNLSGRPMLGDATAAGTRDTLFRLTFANPASPRVVRLTQVTGGVGSGVIDTEIINAGIIPAIEFRQNASISSSPYTASTLDQSSTTLPLPVDLIEQQVVWAGDDALVSWSTATEINNERFDIYRSMDGSYFELAGTVASQGRGGNSSSKLSYSFVDPRIASTVGDRVYYQIRQYDYNGTTESFKVMTLDKVRDGQPYMNFVMFPNPNTGDNINLRVSSSSNEDLNVFIYNALGVVVQSSVALTFDKGVHSIDTKSLSKGAYYVALEQGDNREIKQLLVH